MNKFEKIEKTVYILIDNKGKIHYSNIDKFYAQEYLRNIDILDYLPIEKTIHNNYKHYTVTVEKVDINNQQYYLVLIQPHKDFYEYAYKDSVTGLYNRNYWEQLISGMLHRPMPKIFTLIIIDVDNLKHINDTKGHLFGDKAIRIVGRSIIESIRKCDIAIRYGGDEFFVLLLNTKRTVVKKVINRIKKKISEKGKKENIHIEISAGAACSNCAHEIEKTITIADDNMYKEKAKKKVKLNKIIDDITELKDKIETLNHEIKSKANENSNKMITKGLFEINMKLEEMINKYSRNA